LVEKQDKNYEKAKTHFLTAMQHIQCENWIGAEREFKASLTHLPQRPSTLINLGVVLIKLGKLSEARVVLDRARSIEPMSPEPALNRGLLLFKEHKYEEAITNFELAIELKPDYAQAWTNRGISLKALRRLEEALASHDRSIELSPEYGDAWNNRGNVLADLMRRDEALSSFIQAIEIDPRNADSWVNMGNALSDLGRYEEALTSYRRSLVLKPNTNYVFGDLVHTKMKICDWSDLHNQCETLKTLISRGERAISPFVTLGLIDDSSLQKRVAERHANELFNFKSQLDAILKKPSGGKIRVGYFSADFYDHATMYLIGSLFECHDKTKYEIFGFSFGTAKTDTMSSRARDGVDSFIDVTNLSDAQVALLARQHGIDIAVDLKGYTKDSRPRIFAHRAAPIQINYLGFPGTMGAKDMDYLVADSTLVPDRTRNSVSEKIIYLPNSYQVNDSKREISDRSFTREEVGLPKHNFIFCSFNSSWKINPRVFDVWARIMRSVPRSVLWLYEENSIASENLRAEAKKRDVDPSRLIFARFMPNSEHLARYRLADLFLDTYPCGAHTTASDALWAGLPVLTRLGGTFASRVAGSLLHSVGLEELITQTSDDYERVAIELATNPEKLQVLRLRLAENRSTCPLFNTKLFARHIESAYRAAYDRYHANLAPDHIWVDG